MEERNVYQDISRRTDGDVYIGVVGPVRTGKSTFIKRFMDTVVLPNISDESVYRRTVDELPQSSAGKTIMTTEPKFIPEESVRVDLGDNVSFRVRMIDCVGYLVESALGHSEDDSPRMVRTPWSDEEIPFNDAAEIGTKKVITDHSSIGLVITADGSFGEIPREDYLSSESRVIAELKAINKPFIILLNSADPEGEYAQRTANELASRYDVPAMPVNCAALDETEIKRILAQLLFEFPVHEVKMDLPKWIIRLDKNHWLKASVIGAVRKAAQNVERIRQLQETTDALAESEYIDGADITGLDLGRGNARIALQTDSALFYRV